METIEKTKSGVRLSWFTKCCVGEMNITTKEIEAFKKEEIEILGCDLIVYTNDVDTEVIGRMEVKINQLHDFIHSKKD